jgi:hypothetical protein
MVMSPPVAEQSETTRMLFVEADGQEFIVKGMPDTSVRCVSLWDALRSAMTLAADDRLTIVVDTPETRIRLQPQQSE